jgi:site-specific recombinase XerC
MKKKKITTITDDVLAALVTGTPSLRDRALILVLAESGLRLGEIAELDRTSIASKSHALTDGTVRIIGRGQVIESKCRGAVRDFFIGPFAMAAVDEYLRTVRCDDHEAAMFLSTDGRRLDSRAIQRIVRKLTDRLGLTPILTHGFRCGLVLRLFNAGSPPCGVKRLLGYSRAGSSDEIVPPTQDTLVCNYLRAIGSFPWYQTP